MNIFQADLAFAITLIALVMGTRLLMDVNKEKDLCCDKFYKTMGYVAVVGALLTLVCIGWNSYKEYKNPPMGNMPFNRMMDPRIQRSPMMMNPKTNLQKGDQSMPERQGNRLPMPESQKTNE